MYQLNKFILGIGIGCLLVVIHSTPGFAQTCVESPGGIISWWPFDETTDTMANDINCGGFISSVHSIGESK